jgi:hypothetical protein
MTSVTAAISCLGFNVPASLAFPSAQGVPQDQPANQDGWKTDPQVWADSRIVLNELKDRMSDNALSIPQLQMRLPSLTKDKLDRAVDRLIYTSEIRRLGKGTASDPYRYYERPLVGS